MQVLAVRHVPFEDLGWIAPALKINNLPFACVDLFRDPDANVPVEEAAGLIFLGGPMSANDDLPFLRRELSLIDRALKAEKPMLGVCLGAQLIAKACGSHVYRNPVKEIGWAPVYLTEAARRDRLFADLGPEEIMFHWHGETFDLPAGAEWLAYSKACRNQAFRLDPWTYGLQFHLEVTPAMIADWCEEDANCADVRELTEPIDPNVHAVRLQNLAQLVFGRWAGMVHEAAESGI